MRSNQVEPRRDPVRNNGPALATRPERHVLHQFVIRSSPGKLLRTVGRIPVDPCWDASPATDFEIVQASIIITAHGFAAGASGQGHPNRDVDIVAQIMDRAVAKDKGHAASMRAGS